MPGCGAVCWYALEKPLMISKAQRDYFILKMDETTYATNVRNIGFGNSDYTAKFFYYGAFAPTPTPIPVPPTPPNATAPIVDL